LSVVNSQGDGQASALDVTVVRSSEARLRIQRASPAGTGSPNALVRIAGSARIAACLAAIAIIVVSLVPGEWRPSIGIAKAIEHAIAYAIVGALVAMQSGAKWRWVLVLIALAGFVEFAQAWIPGRDANLIDFLASGAGALAGTIGYRLVVARLPRDSGSA
jgi:VanZ family protein